MADDPFAKYAVAADPFAAYVVADPKTVAPAVIPSAGATPFGQMMATRQGQGGFSDETPPVEHEPDTYWGGVRKGLSDYASELGAGMFQSAAHPQTAGDFLSLVAPTMKGPLLPQAARGPIREAPAAVGKLVTDLPGRDIASAPFRLAGYVAKKPPFSYGGGQILGPVADSIAGKIGRTVQPVTDAERAFAGTIGRTPTPPPSVTVNAPTPGVDRVGAMLDEARAARAAQPPPAAPGAPPEPPPGSSHSSAGTAPTGAPAPPAAASGLSVADRAQLVRQGYDPATIARIEQNLAGASTAPIEPAAAGQAGGAVPAPTPAPLTGTLRMATPEPPPVTAPPIAAPPVAEPVMPPPAPVETLPPAAPVAEPPSPFLEQLQASAQARGVTPAAEPTPPLAGTGTAETGAFRSQPAGELDALRQSVGAEKAGRVLGMTTDEVRQAATEIGAGTNRGDASLVLPEPRLQKIIEALKQIERGSPERFAYVDKTTNPKNWAQIETIRRVMEALGFIAPVATGVGAADALRGRVRERLQEQ